MSGLVLCGVLSCRIHKCACCMHALYECAALPCHAVQKVCHAFHICIRYYNDLSNSMLPTQCIVFCTAQETGQRVLQMEAELTALRALHMEEEAAKQEAEDRLQDRIIAASQGNPQLMAHNDIVDLAGMSKFMSPYEINRLSRMQKNRAYLRELGLDSSNPLMRKPANKRSSSRTRPKIKTSIDNATATRRTSTRQAEQRKRESIDIYIYIYIYVFCVLWARTDALKCIWRGGGGEGGR